MVLITKKTFIRAPIGRVFLLSLDIDLHQDSTARTREKAVAGITSGRIGFGQRVTWRGRHFGLMWHHQSEIIAYSEPTFFEDVMVSGAFRSFQHKHFFREESDGTWMEDGLTFSAPIPFLGKMAEMLVLRNYLDQFLEERNAFIKLVAESDQWRKYLPS